MKKLLSLLAAGAMALGLIGCSGDLHDVSLIDLTGYGLRGTLTGWAEADDVALVDNGDGSYSYNFTSTDETTQFAILQMGDGTWGTAYRLAQPKSQGDTANVFSADGDGKSGQSGMTQKVYLGQSAYCMSVPDTKGKGVTITVVPASTYLTVTVKVDGDAPAPVTPVPYYLDAYFVMGDMNGWGCNVDTLIQGATLQKTTGNLTYTYDFQAIGITESEFGIANKGWASKYTGATFAVGTDTDYVACTAGADDNNKITGLTDGANYRLYIQTTPDQEVSIKVEEICAYKIVFVLEDLEDVDYAWINGGFWGGWDTGWPIASWGGPKSPFTAADAVAVVAGTADFTSSKFDVTGVAKPGETISKEVKFVATADDWASTAYDNGNIGVDVTVSGAGTYQVTINCADNEVKSVTKL